MSIPHTHYSTGLPCSCPFTAHLGLPKTAGKLHDFLMNPGSRPDLQTPEAQAFLRHLEQFYHSERTDPLMPWLTREWKKGRLEFGPEMGADKRRELTIPELRIGPRTYHHVGLPPADVNHWADFLHSNHPVRRDLGDLMKHDVHSFHEQMNRWDRAMAEAAHEQALQGGKVVHTTPDEWTVRQLQTPEELNAEGEAMGHCVGGYCGAVQSGRSLIYSLRDPKNSPHATVEISPNHVTSGVRNLKWLDEYFGDPQSSIQRGLQNTPGIQEGLRAYQQQALEMAEGMRKKYDPEVVQWQGLYNELASEQVDGHRRDEFPVQAHPERGEIVQIQGKSNQEPVDEYKARLADWFRTFHPRDRPTWPYADEEDSLQDEDGYHHSMLDHPDLIPLYQERHNGALRPPTEPWEDAYGIEGPAMNPLAADYERLLDNIHMSEVDWGTTRPDPAHIKSIYLLAQERGEIPELAAALEGYQEKQDSHFHEWMDMNYQYAPRHVEPDWPHGWEDKEGGEADEGEGRPYWEPKGSEYGERYYEPEAAEEAYDEAYGEWEGQHGGMNAVSQMYNRLRPHYGPHPETGEQGYWNEVQPPQPVPVPQPAPTPQPEQPPTMAKVASPVIPTKWDALRMPRDQYVGEFPKFPGDKAQFAFSSPEYTAWLESARPEIEAHRQREQEWDQAARNAMGTGRLTPQQVVDLGYRPEDHAVDTDWNAPKWGKWQPLPERLYHVTTNLPAIVADGRLRSPYELDHLKSRGLGSYGQDKTISLTDSPEEARNIERAMREGADVASGRLPIERLVEMAKTGEGAEKPWLNAMFGTYDWSKGNPQGLDDLLLGREPFYRHKLPDDHPLKDPGSLGLGGTLSKADWAQHGFYPYPDAHMLGTPENPAYTQHAVYRNLSPQEKAMNAFEWWRNPWAPMRAWVGKGPSDPLFASSDPEWFANLDPNHIGTVELQSNPGAHGYPMSSLNEWRIPTGEAVNITGINGQPYLPRTSSTVKAAALYQRWVFSPSTGQVELSDNDGDPLQVEYHTDLANKLNEPNLIHGYAYPIGGGWRLTDWESKPLEDPFVVAQVMRALKASEARTEPQGGSWEPESDGQWDRVHHGLPS